MPVATSINYVRRPPPGYGLSLEKTPGFGQSLEKIGGKLGNPGGHVGMEGDSQRVEVQDIRACKTLPSLRTSGFQLTRLKDLPRLSWNSAQQVQEQYYPVLRDLIARETGASRVEIYDHRLRSGSVQGHLEAANGRDRPAGRAHVDYTMSSGPEKLRQTLPEEADRLSKAPYAIIQVWQPLEGPVDDSPLALADASSVAADDLLPVVIPSPVTGKAHAIYAVAHNQAHRWYYTKHMQTNEAYMFIGYHSRDDGRARGTPHTAFHDPNTPPEAPNRHSIEFRALVFWEGEQS